MHQSNEELSLRYATHFQFLKATSPILDMISKTAQQTTHNKTSKLTFFLLQMKKNLLIIIILDRFFSPIHNSHWISYLFASTNFLEPESGGHQEENLIRRYHEIYFGYCSVFKSTSVSETFTLTWYTLSCLFWYFHPVTIIVSGTTCLVNSLSFTSKKKLSCIA